MVASQNGGSGVGEWGIFEEEFSLKFLDEG